MKLGPVTKLHRRNTATSNNLRMMSGRQIVTSLFFSPIYGEFAAIQKPDSGRMVYKIYVFINNNLLS